MFFDNWIIDGYIWSNIVLFILALANFLVFGLRKKKSGGEN